MSVQAFLLTDSQITDERFLVFINVTELQEKQLGNGKCQHHLPLNHLNQQSKASIFLHELRENSSFRHPLNSLRISSPVATFLISLPERQVRWASSNSLISWLDGGMWSIVKLFEIGADREIL